MNRVFGPPNLFGVRNPGRNENRCVAQPLPEYTDATDAVATAPSRTVNAGEAWENDSYCDCGAGPFCERGEPGPMGPRGEPGPPARLVNGEKPAHRASPDRRGPRGPPGRWGREESREHGDRQDLPAIRRTGYLRHLQGRI